MLLSCTTLKAQVQITDFEADRELNQKALFQFKDNASERFSSENNQRYNHLKNSIKTKKITIVELPEELHQEQLLSFWVNTKTEAIVSQNLGTDELFIYRDKVQVLSDDEYAWLGKIINPSNNSEAGNATFIVQKNGEITGTIDIDGAFFDVRPLGASGKHALVQTDIGYFKEAYKNNDVRRSETRPSSNNITDFQAIMSGPRCFPEKQKILALYTANAASGRNMSGIISLAIQEANESYAISEVNNMRLSLAHQQQISFTESANMSTDLSILSGNSTVANLRNQHDADLVVLFTDGNYGGFLGIADAILATSNSAFAITQVDYATGPDYTFAHEVGHLQGAQHSPEDPVDPNGPFSYGYGHKFSYKPSIFLSRVRRSTIMAYPFSPYNSYTYHTTKQFSNPNVTYSGEPTGVANTNENYLVLKNTASTLADFRNPNELNASISISGFGNNYTFETNTCGGNSGYSYEWRKSNNPVSYGTVQSTSSSYSSMLTEGEWYIKLTVTSGVQSVDAYTTVNVNSCDSPDPCEVDPLMSNSVNEESDLPEKLDLLPAYPNPFNPSTQISYSLPEAQQVKLAVYDISGREIAVLADEQKQAGNHIVNFDASGISSGVYFLRMQANGTVQSQKITLIK